MSVKKSDPATSLDDMDSTLPSEGLSPSSRILLAVERLAALGPLSYEALRLELGMSKTATWRIVTTLKEAGWVRLRHGGREIELDHRLDELFATAHFADPEFAGLIDTMTIVAETHAIHLDLFVINPKGQLDLHETTRRLTASAPPVDTQDEAVWLAVRGAMTAQQLERHLQQIAETMEPEALRSLRSILQRMRSGSTPCYHWANEGRFLVVSVRGAMGTPAALRFSFRAATGRVADMLASVEDMHGRIGSLVETFAGLERDA